MPPKPATVKSPDSLQGSQLVRSVRSERAEAIRLQLADAWGEMGAAWGVAPAIARAHAYLMSKREPLTEREVREALRISHRAASIALHNAVAWGIVERVETRRVGQRGPAGVAYRAIGDPWLWFGRIVAERKVREGDPIVAVLERTAAESNDAAALVPDDAELAALAAWVSAFLDFVRLFDRAVDLVPNVDPGDLEHALRLLARIPDERVLRLFALLEAVPEDDVLSILDALSRLSPTRALQATRAVGRVIRPFVR